MFAASPAPLTWSPWLLGSSLLAWWDADNDGLITQVAGAVSSWTDAVGGQALTQGTGSAQPTYSATSFNGRSGVTFDGSTDYLEKTTGLSWLPSGANPSEDWYLVDEVALASDTTSRDFGSWGTAANDSRRANGLGATTLWTARATTGTGAGTGSNTQSATNAFGRHVLRYAVTGTTQFVEVDGVSSTPTAMVPGTVVARLRMGSAASSAASAFGSFVIAARIITTTLTSTQADLLRAYLTRRVG